MRGTRYVVVTVLSGRQMGQRTNMNGPDMYCTY